MKPKLTPEQQEQARKRKNLAALCTNISTAFSFKQVNTWNDVYKYTSIPEGTSQEKLSSRPTYPELKLYLQSLQEQLEKTFQNTTSKSNEEIKPASEIKVALRVEEPKTCEAKDTVPSSDSKVETVRLDELDKPSIENDYLLPPSPGESKSLIKYWHQRKAVKECLDNILVHDIRGQQIIAAAGYGKTFIAGGVACRLKDVGFADTKTFGATRYLYVTKNTVVEQTRRVFENTFGLTMRDGFEVINYEMLRSKAGQLWVQEKSVIVNGEEEIEWTWRPMLNPVVIFWDENQSLKNVTSIQHQIACQVNNIKTPVYQIFISATPYTRVCEAKCFAVSTKKDVTEIFGLPTKLSNATWPTYMKHMCKDSAPEEYNEAAVERLTKDLEKYIVRIRGVRPQFHAINRVKMINFATRDEQKYYDDTEERYLKEKAKLEKDKADGVSGTGLLHLVLLTKRAVAAEFCRRHHFARYMYEAVSSGKAAACAVKYKTTLIPIVKILIEDYGVSRDQISLVWGGGQTQLTKKQKNKAQIKKQAEALEAAGLSVDQMMKDFDLEDVEDRVLEELPEEMRLGGQSKIERQKEIDKFQSGKSLYCIYTFKAGGVGLSLHHTDELTECKVPRQKNGYAITDDFEPYIKDGIKYVPISQLPTRPRKTCLSVAYSAIDMVQSTGRVPRLTSLSDTEQDCILYNGTVEVDIAHVYSSKLKCLSKVVKTHESWVDLIVGGDRQRIVDEHIKYDADNGDGNEELVSAGESEEE